MRRSERWFLRGGFALAALTGVVYGVYRYLVVTAGEFGPEPSPWQSVAQHAHVLAAPVLLFALGYAARGHVQAMLQKGVRLGRRTGLVLVAAAAPMVLGGYAIQVATAQGTRAALGWIHSAVSAVFVVVYLAHWAKPRFERR